MTSSWFNGRTALQVLSLFASMLFSAVIIYFDVLTLGNTMGESSLVEISQAIAILCSGLFFALGARNNIDQRGYLLIVATLFLCLFVRENDALLDTIVHGFWRVPALIVLGVGTFAVFRNKNTIRAPLSQHTKDSSFWLLIVGFLQLIVFSRLFGSGQLWEHVPGQVDFVVIKRMVQEGLELVSYALIFVGSYLSYKYQFGASQNPVYRSA
jgi:hypothetical protein